MIEVQASINFIVVLFISAPLLLALIYRRKISSALNYKFLIGVGSIIFSAVSYYVLNDGLSRFESANVSQEEIQLKIDVIEAFGIWVYLFPATYLGIGINLLTDFLNNPQQVGSR
jgi:hypothetical protein